LFFLNKDFTRPKKSGSFMSIDIHTHAFHPKVAEKVVKQLEDHYQLAPVGNGLIEDLLLRLDKAGITHAALHTAATKAEQVIPANKWALFIQQEYPQISPFGTVHPDFKDWEKELLKLEQAGIKGIKLHPDFQGFNLDDPRLEPIFEDIGDRFLLMIHIGDRLPPEKNPSSPQKLSALLKKFARLRVIAAHLGGFMHWQYVVEHLAGKDLYLDTSSSLMAIPDHHLFDIFNHHPRGKILFGSDYPLFDPLEEIERLQKKLHLSSNEVDELLTNGESLLGLP
jgi:uncharacterized protein